ncbi:carbohydrate ABC transporter permease [Actinokineospora iranica]|uniref:Carbohydrate ABC transporter membrane protein 1, CUT1 family n=1 Tax=Actinokineospora iranica TaxID=1271860 RepID=A0A1G6WJ37_9PSEU|nr:sugar ABC transporter permease [Actinokineospora iranica]SDD65794.1 carbohydrate ABC transporter membrane protein 1, CUT1 family [Actinokineospora iranica]
MATLIDAPITPEPPAKAPVGRKAGVGRLAALLVSPTLLVLGLVVAYPIVSALRLAFYQRNDGVDPETGLRLTGDRFVGIDNFTDMFVGDAGERFRNALLNTTTFTIVAVSLEVVLGILMALVMHKAFKGRALVRASILVPWAVPTAIAGLLWRWIFQADGVANDLLPGDPVLWTTDGIQAWFAVIIADTWKTAPFIGLLVLAGLQVISNEVYEAAKLDGASPWKTFWSITLPLVKPTLMVAVLFRILDTLRMFDLPYTLIGPGKNATDTVTVIAFEEAVKFGKYGPASAYAIFLFLYVAVVAFVFVRLLGADVVGARSGRNR